MYALMTLIIVGIYEYNATFLDLFCLESVKILMMAVNVYENFSNIL